MDAATLLSILLDMKNACARTFRHSVVRMKRMCVFLLATALLVFAGANSSFAATGHNSATMTLTSSLVSGARYRVSMTLPSGVNFDASLSDPLWSDTVCLSNPYGPSCGTGVGADVCYGSSVDAAFKSLECVQPHWNPTDKLLKLGVNQHGVHWVLYYDSFGRDYYYELTSPSMFVGRQPYWRNYVQTAGNAYVSASIADTFKAPAMNALISGVTLHLLSR